MTKVHQFITRYPTVDGYELKASRVVRANISAMKFDVIIEGDGHALHPHPHPPLHFLLYFLSTVSYRRIFSV